MSKLLGPALAAPVTVWLLVTFAAPLGVVVLLSLQEYPDPFAPLFQPPSLAQFRLILGDAFHVRIILETLALGLGVAALSLVLGLPLAIWLVSVPTRWRPLAFAVVLIPLLTNVVVRSLGIALLLAPDGLINQALGLLGLPPLEGMLYTHGAVAIALAQVFLPFIVLALYDVLQGVSPRTREAAHSLGASPTMRFWTVDFPLALPGIRAGVTLVFLMSSTAYVSATLLGGKKVLVTGMLVWQEALSLPAAFALARAPFKGLTALAAFWTLPLSLPHVAIGVGMLRLLQTFVALPAYLGLAAVHVVLIIPFCVSLLHASVQQLDRAQEEAAASLGAGPLRRFFLVLLPGLAPGLAAAATVSFLLSFGEVTVTSFLTTARLTTLPVRIYAEASFSLTLVVHAVSTLLIAATVLALLALNRAVRLDTLYAR